jgi:Uma2 family endonuclease
MSIALRKPMTLGEFLDWEATQPTRFEFDGFAPVAMTGGTAAHARIQRNLAMALGSRLRGKPCEFFGNDLKIEVAGRIRYPDGFVACSPVLPGQTRVTDPVVIFEVLSESTWRIDWLTKNDEYARTDSVRRYVILSQDEIGGTMFERVENDWIGRLLSAENLIRMPEIGIEVPMGDFYEGVDFAQSE